MQRKETHRKIQVWTFAPSNQGRQRAQLHRNNREGVRRQQNQTNKKREKLSSSGKNIESEDEENNNSYRTQNKYTFPGTRAGRAKTKTKQKKSFRLIIKPSVRIRAPRPMWQQVQYQSIEKAVQFQTSARRGREIGWEENTPPPKNMERVQCQGKLSN